MPYKRKGKTIYHKKDGKWSVKQKCKSVKNAKKAIGLLEGLESGSIKPSQVGQGKYAKKGKKSSSQTAKINKRVAKALKLRKS